MANTKWTKWSRSYERCPKCGKRVRMPCVECRTVSAIKNRVIKKGGQ